MVVVLGTSLKQPIRMLQAERAIPNDAEGTQLETQELPSLDIQGQLYIGTHSYQDMYSRVSFRANHTAMIPR